MLKTILLAGGITTAALAGETLPAVVIPRIITTPTLDGMWKSGEWNTARRIPLEGNPAAEIRLAFTGCGLWIGALLQDATPALGQTPRGESLHEEDVFEIFFDGEGESRRYGEWQIARSGRIFAKEFQLLAPPRVTPTGRLTRAFTRRFLAQRPSRWPAGFRAAVGSSPTAWCAEIFIPWTSLRASIRPRANFAVHDWDRPRNEPGRKGQFSYWSEVEPGCPQISPSRMGKLIFANTVSPGSPPGWPAPPGCCKCGRQAGGHARCRDLRFVLNGD